MTWAILADDGRAHRQAIAEIEQHAAHGSPRVLAVVGGALLEPAVNRTLRERFRNDKKVADNILNTEKPLGNLGPKIDVLYLLGAFDEKARGALKGISKIRNIFAHELNPSFDSVEKEFTKALGRLTLHEGRTLYPHHLGGGDSATKIEPVKTSRDQFTVNLKLALILLMRDRVSHESHTNRALTRDEIEALIPPDVRRRL